MTAEAQDFDFDEYDKPGAERSRRRRGEDDTLDSDLDEDLLEEDWLAGKKNPSEVSDEELNDDLLQSDDEDLTHSGQNISSASYSMGMSYDHQDNLEDEDYTDNVDLGGEGAKEKEPMEWYHQEGEEAYPEEYRHGDNTDLCEDQIDYSSEKAEGDEGHQYEVLDIQINEPIDGEFQDDDFQTSNGDELAQEDTEEVEEEEQQEENYNTKELRVYKTEGENEAFPEGKVKDDEEDDEEEEEGEESGRIRFKSERKEGTVLRLSDVVNKRRNIPETLELSEKAKEDLMAFDEQEWQKRQNRYGRRGRGVGRGGRGSGGFPGFGMGDFRGGQRRKMHDQMLSPMGKMRMQPSSRMPHLHQLPPHPHHPSRPRGPPTFQDHGRPIPQQPLQPLLPLHMAHRSPPLRPPMEPPPRMMSPPPSNFPQHHQQQSSQPKNIHINPHFRGPTQSSVQMPLMPPAQSQSRPAVGPQRFPGMGDFQHMQGNFGQPQRPPPHMDPMRNPPPQGPQDREPLFMGECGESKRFPGQHIFDRPGPSPLMNSNNNLHPQQLPVQGHLGFGPPGPPFSQPGSGPMGLFPREPSRPNNLPTHQGMMNLNQQGGPPNQPRMFMSPRQPFGQQGDMFPPPQVQFGMQGLMHGPPVSQLSHHNPLSPHPMHHQQHHHRQDILHQQQINLNEPRSMTHHGQNPFHQQQAHGSPRQMTPRPQNPQQRNMMNRQRMNTPISKQMQQRNSNLRELPVAPANKNMHGSHPAPSSTSPAANIKLVARATPGTRPGQNIVPTSGGGRGRGRAARTESQPWVAGGADAEKETTSTQSGTTPQNPDEDEETRQYRLKIEEQKRLREEILKRKEMRRQMQAGVRKKELLERLSSNPNTQTQDPTTAQVPLSLQSQQLTRPQLPQQQEQKQQQIQAQQNKQGPRRPQPAANHALKIPNQGNMVPTGNTIPRPNVKSRLQMLKGTTQEPQTSVEQQQQQQGRTLQSTNRPSTVQVVSPAVHQKITAPSVNPGLGQAQGPKPGAKRTVMQRVKNAGVEGQQVPQKVRVVKLSGLSEKGPEATSGAQQQQGNWQAAQTNQSIQRRVTMMAQQQQGPGGAPQAGRGATSDSQQNRVVVTGRGRGRGAGQMGRGLPLITKQTQRGAENLRCAVSIEGLSSSTTEFQLKNLLRSIGPVEMFKMVPQQRKAIAKFSSPQHAANFQMSFHRHMIDLSHIDVSLIDG